MAKPRKSRRLCGSVAVFSVSTLCSPDVITRVTRRLAPVARLLQAVVNFSVEFSPFFHVGGSSVRGSDMLANSEKQKWPGYKIQFNGVGELRTLMLAPQGRLGWWILSTDLTFLV